MNQFFLNTPAIKSSINISHQDAILLLGSCFTENIGEKLLNSKFNVNINPFGIIYNPISIANSLTRILNKEPYTEQDLSVYSGKFFSFDHHGSFSSFNQQECLAKINNEINCAHQHIQETKTIVITLGTAWVYENIETKKLVANCHKIPAKNFTKRLLTVDEIVRQFSPLANKLKNINFVFTVSPVRHVSDGLHENNISKSVLHLAIHELTKNHTNCHYFGAYEMVIDELRDYRFFKEDMVHPNELAVKYIWERIQQSWIDATSLEFINEAGQYKRLLEHRVLNEYERGKHQGNLKVAKTNLLKNYPNINIL